MKTFSGLKIIIILVEFGSETIINMDEFIILLNIMILVIGLKIYIGADGHGGCLDGIMVGIGLMCNQIIIITIIFLINMIALNVIGLEFESGYWEDISHNYNGSYD